MDKLNDDDPIRECILSGGVPRPPGIGPDGIALWAFASSACGATNFYTGTATFPPGAVLALHTHTVSEAITVVEGKAVVSVAGRSYILGPFDSIHVPALTPHEVRNEATDAWMTAHSTFAQPDPARCFTDPSTQRASQDAGDSRAPEHVRRFAEIERYELAEGAVFCDLFAKRFGSVGICGGYGIFRPGASLPCHTHRFDESITIVSGEARCQVQGREYKLSGYDTAFVPEGRAHRFLNLSDQPMAMIWVYAGDEPDRTLVDAGYCAGTMSDSADSDKN